MPVVEAVVRRAAGWEAEQISGLGPTKSPPRAGRSGAPLTATARRLAATVFLAVMFLLVGPGASPPLAGTTAGPATERTELAALRTETARFFREPDGTYTAEIHAGPINYRTPDGSWAKIDPTLVAADEFGYAWKNRSGPLTVEFAPSAREADMVLVRDARGKSLHFGLGSVNRLATPVVAGSRITYPDVYAGVDLVFEVRNSDLKEALVLTDRPKKAVSYRFTLARAGLLTRQEPSGEVSLLDADGEVAFRIPRAWMADSAIDPHSGEPARSDAVALSLSANGNVLTLTPDLAWLQDARRVYPVTIDPSLTTDTTLDTFVQSNIIGGNSTDTELKTGTYDGGTTKARSLLKFNVSSLNGKDIISATFSIYEKWSWSCSARQVNAYRVTESWSSSVDWSPQPTVHTPPFDTTTAAKGFSTSCPAGRITFDATGVVTNWTNGTQPNYGIELRAASESDSYYWKKFTSVETGNDPYLSISYDSLPTAPTSLSPAGGTVDTSATRTTPRLSAIYNDADSGDTGNVNYQVCSSSTCASVVASGTGSPANPGVASPWTVPAGKLVSGVQYWWRAQGDDGPNVSGWTATRSFVPDLAPATPTELFPNSGVFTSATETLAGILPDPDADDSGRLRFEVFDAGSGALVASGVGSTTLAGRRSSWSIPTGALSDGGTYRWHAWADDDFLTSAPSADRSALLASGGDVYHARVYAGDPTLGWPQVTEEWARINTFTARTDNADVLTSRDVAPCPTSFPAGRQCEEVRSATKDESGAVDTFTNYIAERDSAELSQIASLLDPATLALQTPTAQGPLDAALAPWQTAPPLAGTSYELYESVDAESGERTRFWIEARTRMPLKQIIEDASGLPLQSDYWTYDASRLTLAQVGAGFFSIAKPGGLALDKTVEVHTTEPIGSVADIETSQAFLAYDVGRSARVPDDGGALVTVCLTATDVVRQVWAASETETYIDPDPEITPDPFGPETYVIASYTPLPASGRCEPTLGSDDEAAFQVVSMARGSSMAAAAHVEITDPAIAIDADPADADYPRGGLARSMLVEGASVTGYVLPLDEDSSSALIDPPSGSSTVVITGDLDKNTVFDYGPLLAAR